MCKLMRLAAGFLCLGVLALGTVVSDPACLVNFPRGWDPDKRASLAEEIARQEQLKQQQELLRRRRQAKRRVAAEVIAGRLSLAEAIEQFHALDREWPELRSASPTSEELELSAEEWGVLYFVQLVLADRPDEAAAVAGRLEKELQQLLADRKKHRPEPAEGRR